MTIVRLMGGIGNQMFQYAVGRAVAKRNNEQLKLDVSYFEQDPLRNYQLHHFSIAESIASSGEIARVTGRGDSLKKRALHRMERLLLPYYKRSMFEARVDCFDPNVLLARKNVYLSGYWQSEKYFKNIEAIIRQDFAFRYGPDAKNQKIAKAIANCNSVSLHVRRGDYVSNPKFYRKFGVCSLDYYQRAVANMAEKVSTPHFFVFSDDLEWARDNLKLQHAITVVDHNDADKACEDLQLMSLCKYHIIANSSFSWWGAWLCSFPEKIVIAPKKWMNESDRDTRDLLPDSWHRT